MSYGPVQDGDGDGDVVGREEVMWRGGAGVQPRNHFRTTSPRSALKHTHTHTHTRTHTHIHLLGLL